MESKRDRTPMRSSATYINCASTYNMIVKSIVLLIAVNLVCGQLEQGIFAQLYYPPVQHARPPSSSNVPHRDNPRTRAMRSYFDRDDNVREGNNAMLNSMRAKMADPQWTPNVESRTRYLE